MNKTRAPSVRSISASEVARSIKHFDTWSTYQACEQVAYSDLPIELRADVAAVFDVNACLPLCWVDKSSDVFKRISALAPDLLVFLQTAYTTNPALFSTHISSDDCNDLFSELQCVFLAWRQLQWMRKAKEKWSEADFAANVYNVFRSPAIRRSAYRTHCTISLPQPLPHLKPTAQAARILRPQTVVPDSAIFICAASIRRLSLSRTSPWKVLNSHPAVKKYNRAPESATFRHQSSPCAALPDAACFEFASSFWEDKKPAHELLEHAYRQNRMATAAAVRHLHSLRVQSPVFGLVWSNGTVRAHVDWCLCDGDAGQPSVFSAPYPGPDVTEHDAAIFHEWNLDNPCDILQVYLLIRNLDTWTAGRFRERIEAGVASFVKAVVEDGQMYTPWKRQDDGVLKVLANANNILPEPVVTGFPTPPPPPKKSGGGRNQTSRQRR